MKVYLAGKIKHTDWRHDIFDLTSALKASDIKEVDGCHYVGPFFIGCDHGCYHGDSAHGRGLGKGTCLFYEINFAKGISETRQKVVKLCENWIKESDVVFCWIDSLDAFGTLVEIGYAKALEKPIFICVDSKYDNKDFIKDMWFPLFSSSYVIFVDSAKEGWVQFIKWKNDGPNNEAKANELLNLTQKIEDATDAQIKYIKGLLKKKHAKLKLPYKNLTKYDAKCIISHLAEGKEVDARVIDTWIE